MPDRPRIKRRAVQNDDGWTVITHGLSKVSLKDDEKNSNAMPSTVVGLTVELLSKDFRARQEKWQDTACARQIDTVVEKKRNREGKRNVKNALCIGIGSFSRDWEHRHRALWQLVLFVWVVERCKSSIPYSYSSDSHT